MLIHANGHQRNTKAFHVFTGPTIIRPLYTTNNSNSLSYPGIFFNDNRRNSLLFCFNHILLYYRILYYIKIFVLLQKLRGVLN